MAIFAPSKTFEGSEMGYGDLGKYIKDDVRQVRFTKTSNQEGTWLFFLPPYKADQFGQGVWYKVISVRDNFGDGAAKDRYYVKNPDTDPATYFAKLFARYYPQDAKYQDVVDDKGRKMRKYPAYGRIAKRVIYNVAYPHQLHLGGHVLDLPAYNGADIIDKWHKEKDIHGHERSPICTPEKCIPVFIKLNDGASGSPWQISPDPSQAAQLPVELCDADLGYIYNLDTIFIEKTNDEIIDKLRAMYIPEVFEKCIAGFGGSHSVAAHFEPTRVTAAANPIAASAPPLATQPPGVYSSPAITASAPPPVTQPPAMQAPAPQSMQMPKANISPAVTAMVSTGFQAKPAAAPAPEAKALSTEEALAFLQSR